jgi:hypothetical protein
MDKNPIQNAPKCPIKYIKGLINISKPGEKV